MGGDWGGEDSDRDVMATSNKECRNKRKFLSDSVVETPIDESASPLNEFHGHKSLVLNVLGSLGLRPKNVVEKVENEEFQGDDDLEDSQARLLEELLINNLLLIFQTAIKRVVECGYSELAAGWAVLNSGLSRGNEDFVSNIVDNALSLLETEKECNIPKKPVFEGLKSLAEYFVLEMTSVVLEARPDLTITKAMWCLVMSDMNLSMACSAEECPRPSSSGHYGTKEKAEASGHSNSGNKNPGKEPMPDSRSSHPKTPVRPPLQPPNCTTHPGKKGSISIKEVGEQLCLARDHVRDSAQAAVTNEKPGVGKKAKSKKDKSRQKAFQLENGHKGHVSEEAFKAKFSTLGNMVLEKSLKSQSNLLKKIADANLSKPDVSAPDILVKQKVSSPKAKSISPQDPRLKAKTHVSESSRDTDYYAGIPYDETLQKHIPQDEKDENILTLMPHKQELEKKLQYWSDWANEKVMQAAKTLAKDQGELKMLRKEKEEEEGKCNKDKQTIEDSANKRILEMKTALSKANSQIEASNSHFHKLQEENSALRRKMGVSSLRASESTDYLQEAIMREQEATKKCQSLDSEKSLYLDKLTSAKREVAELNNRLQKMRERQDQFQVLLRQEEREKLKAITKYDSLRSKREKDEALAIAKAENITQMAEMNIRKCKEEIRNLENMISELRLEAERSKIAALRISYGSCSSNNEDFFTFRALQFPKITKRLHNFGSGSVKPERECVMCMTEEISVVLLPCAHQVLCVECSILHEKQGMDTCPSCRTTIEKRIPVRYRPV